MPKNPASTKATGGGGYTFADKVAAGFLAFLLNGEFPLEPELGIITAVDFESRDSGHHLDDLMLTLRRGSDDGRCLISVKSNEQLTKSGFHAEFGRDVWEQWNSGAESNFNRNKDFLGLVVGVLDEATFVEWQELQKQASSTTSERLVARLSRDGQMSAIQRSLYASLRKTQNGTLRDANETVRLISRLRVLRFSEERETSLMKLCVELVSAGTVEEGAKLWSRLLQLAAENRGAGGHFDLTKLIRDLRPDFALRDYPDFRADWKKIESVSAENIKSTRDVVGSGIQLPRKDQQTGLAAAIDTHNFVAVAGESGSGKSAIVAHILTSRSFKRVIWLTAGQLSKTSHAEVAQSFGLTYSVPELISHSATERCALVVDAFEKFEGEARRRVIELLGSIKEEALVRWKVILTCQPQSLEAAHDLAVQVGISDFHKVDFEKPSIGEVYKAVAGIPAMQALVPRPEVQSILCNLTVLDWVLRADIAQSLSATKAWIGETEIIDAIWERWAGPGTMKFARDSLLRTLAKREGEKLSGAVHVDTIPSTELPLLGELEREGLIRVRGQSVQFAHDLMGDWARYRCLKFEGNNAPEAIKSLAHVPRWGRAIRLYAQTLAERRDGLDGWKAARSELSGEDADSRVAADFFLDALIFAANSEYLLDQVWPDLMDGGAQILNRLLKRLLHVASVPDWRVIGLDDQEWEEQAQAWFRIPQPLYWYPVLRVLSSHSGDVAKHALVRGAEVCALWLRVMPPGMLGRPEAGKLALELAREAQGLLAEGVFFDNHDKVIYEAGLSAAPEYPDECAQIALELCGRRDEPAHAVQRRLDEQKRQAKQMEEWLKNNPEKRRKQPPTPPTIISSLGPLPPPFPDGPSRAVPKGFRAAVMEAGALNGLISVRPEIAREVLLATCIEEPTRREISHDRFDRDRLGLADWRKCHPPIYWKGSFLRFLQDAPAQGVDAVVRLVNHATTQWIENGLGREPTADEKCQYGLHFEFGGRKKCWLGNPYVYGWHREAPLYTDTVSCALMAFERWCYEQIEKGQDIGQRVRFIFEHGESAAFAGVLITVGLRFPAFFTGILQPLLGDIRVYDCQANLARQEAFDGWAYAMTNEPQQAIRLAAEWHRMSHRRMFLGKIVAKLMLTDDATKDYISARETEWKKASTAENDTRGQESAVPEDFEETIKVDRWTLELARYARQLLDDQATLAPSDIAKFAEQVRAVAEGATEDEDARLKLCRTNSVAGGLAVLVVKHRSWLSQTPDVKNWCFTTLKNLKPVTNEEMSVWVINDHQAEAFLGEAGVALLQESNEEWVLRLAFTGITGSDYSSIFFTLLRAYLLRNGLGDRFGELVNAMVSWSALRHAAGRRSGYFGNEVDRLDTFRAPLFRRLAAGKLRGPLIPLKRVETLGRRLVARIDRRTLSKQDREARKVQREWNAQRRKKDHELNRDMPHLDLGVIQRGFGFLHAMLRERESKAEPLLRRYIEELLDMEMRSLPQAPPGDEWSKLDGTPYESDRWIMGCLAEYMARSNSVETARLFYRPILALGPTAKYWVEDLLRSWITVGMPNAIDIGVFASIWEDMIAYAETLPNWQPRDPRYWTPAATLAVDLMGLGEAGSRVLGDCRYQNLIKRMAPVFERWADRWLKYTHAAAWFANFLRTESGRVLLQQGVKQLAAAAPTMPDKEWFDHDLGSLFTDVLRACWKHSQREIEADPGLRQAFLGLLALLCARQIPEALHLRTKVANVLGST
jgi:hypothetical protein